MPRRETGTTRRTTTAERGRLTRLDRSRTPHVRVRMYRQGLGDCFLVSLPSQDGAFHMLIDCGVIIGTPDPATRLRKVAEDIERETEGKLDIVVATHEHWDHLSGFVQAREIFDRMAIGQVWFAWTEDPQNPVARRLRRQRALRVRRLRVAAEQLQAHNVLAGHSAVVGELLGFFGDGLGATGQDTAAALRYLRERTDADIRHLRPGGKPLALRGVEGVRIFVLGPPEDETLLRKSRPTARGREVYELSDTLTAEDTFMSALFEADGGQGDEAPGDEIFTRKDLRELSEPFDAYYQLKRAEARENEVMAQYEAQRRPSGSAQAQAPPPGEPQTFFARHYGFEPNAPDVWRRIDHDWLGSAGRLALKLDEDTNNTSLVLAIELMASGRVLLFAADAQVGNWESWGTLKWMVQDGNGGRQRVTASDLLDRTVLYKVGHHGSHNATLRALGLELMNSPDLVAMIPVDQQMAKQKGWSMPFRPLLRRLEERCRGRIIRVDNGVSPQGSGTNAEWHRFEESVNATPLFVDFRVDL